MNEAHSQSPQEAADRLAIRELFDAYAHCADRRDAEGQKALFTADTRFAVYMDGAGSEPTYLLDGREALTTVFADLNRYEVTTHFNGQSTVTLDGDRATGESYTIAHHLFSEDGVRTIGLVTFADLPAGTSPEQNLLAEAVFAKLDGFRKAFEGVGLGKRLCPEIFSCRRSVRKLCGPPFEWDDPHREFERASIERLRELRDGYEVVA
jgi:hypothetical protein